MVTVSSVMAAPPAVKLEMPATVNTPESVIASAVVVTVRLLPTPTVPRSSALPAFRTTALAPVLLRFTAPVKALVTVSSVMTAPPAVKLDVPPTVIMPLSVMLPFVAVAIKLRPTVTVPRSSAIAELINVASAVGPFVARETAPVKELT